MPELPDIELYRFKLEEKLLTQTLIKVRVLSPFLLRTVHPPISAIEGKMVVKVDRIGKRIVIAFEQDFYVVIHLMIAGRLHWLPTGGTKPVAGKIGLATFEFGEGMLLLTEAGSKKRASLSFFQGSNALREIDPGGREVEHLTEDEFTQLMRRENHTLKRTLTDPHVFSGIGNAYSDEILFEAKLSPLRMSRSLSEEELNRLLAVTKNLLAEAVLHLREKFADRFPGRGDVTAFRPEFKVHGKFGQPCVACGKPIQRIQYSDNECNYCAVCQNGGRILADRALSRLLKGDWPRSLEEI